MENLENLMMFFLLFTFLINCSCWTWITFCCRWEAIASYITQHLPASTRSAKEVLAHAKALQKDDTHRQKVVNASAYELAMKPTASKGPASGLPQHDDPSQRFMCKLIILNVCCEFS